MDIYNTVVTVVANLEAEDEQAAIGALSRSLIAHGFDTITYPADELTAYAGAFVAEDGTEPHELPAVGAGPLASRFTADEVEALILTAADLWMTQGTLLDSGQVLSRRQSLLAERAARYRDMRMEG